MFDEVLFLLPQKVLAGIRGEAGGVWAGRTGSRRCLAIFMRSVKFLSPSPGHLHWQFSMLSVLQLIPARLGPPTAISHMNPLAKDPPPLPNLSSEFDADGDIIELDFEETSGLSDMNAFNKAQKKGEEKKLSSSGLESSLPLATNEKAKGQKKTRKEKEVEKREQIENSCSGMRQLLFPILFLVPTSGLRRLS
ncbi:hypothetical protein JOM56_004444 [Amanita muscaria]